MRDTQRPMRRMFAFLSIALCTATQAHAGLNVCNKTDKPAKVALGRFDGKTWTSEGWWNIAPHDCAAIIGHALSARYYYLYGTDAGPGRWSGSRGFCVVSSAQFKIAGRADCLRRGYEQKPFFEVDTGSEPNWTQSLSD